MSVRLDYQKRIDGPVWSVSHPDYDSAIADADIMDRGNWIPQSITDKDDGKTLIAGSKLMTAIKRKRAGHTS